jgi:hypothetical protein
MKVTEKNMMVWKPETLAAREVGKVVRFNGRGSASMIFFYENGPNKCQCVEAKYVLSFSRNKRNMSRSKVGLAC